MQISPISFEDDFLASISLDHVKSARTKIEYFLKNASSDQIATALSTAVTCNAVKCLELLLENGLNPDLIDPRLQGSPTPLILALEKSHISCAIMLIEKGANINQEYDGLTTLHIALRKHCDKAAVMLIEKGHDVNATANQKEKFNTVLHDAVLYSSYETIELLLKKGADANKENAQGYTPMHFAIRRDASSNIIQLLQKYKADINFIPYYYAPNLGPPLFDAVKQKFIEAIKALHALGADIDYIDKMGVSAIALAAPWNESLECLIELGANVNPDHQNPTTPGQATPVQPLLEAITLFEPANALTLIFNGARIDVKNPEGQAPLQLALENKPTITTPEVMEQWQTLIAQLKSIHASRKTHLDSNHHSPATAIIYSTGEPLSTKTPEQEI